MFRGVTSLETSFQQVGLNRCVIHFNILEVATLYYFRLVFHIFSVCILFFFIAPTTSQIFQNFSSDEEVKIESKERGRALSNTRLKLPLDHVRRLYLGIIRDHSGVALDFLWT